MRTLIVCEKPSAASRVAAALDDDGSPFKRDSHGVPYFECSTKQGSVTVCSAIGHLYSVDSKGRIPRNTFPVWDFDWDAKSKIERTSARLARWISVISSLAMKADRFVNACDYDIEGSLIGLTILRYACKGADTRAGRMKFSTMTEKELRTAYRSLSPQLDISVAEAGQCRHELDWLYGINLSRALTESALKQRGSYNTLSAGRVQGPTLNFVVERELEIESFVPTPFWNIDAIIQSNGTEYALEYSKARISTENEAFQVVKDCQGQNLVVESVESHELSQPPPYPFDLSSLQAEAFRHFHYSPSKTLAVAERLYLDALVSYPRTSSQKLPADVGFRENLQQLSRQSEYHLLTSGILKHDRLIPNQGPNDDPAHPAIYPTGETPRSFLGGPEGRLYDLIVRRFMATFGEACIRQFSKMTLQHGPHRFFLKGSSTLKAGWTEFYAPYVAEDSRELPSLQPGEKVPVERIAALERFVEPPPRYNPNSLLREMEDARIGTKATRSDIIDTLYKRGYITKVRIEATPLAVEVTRVLAKYCPVILDPKFTARLEQLISEIQQGTRSRESTLLEALDHFRPVMLDLATFDDEVGSQLSRTVSAQKLADKTFASPCPLCGSALKIIRSKQSRKRFIGCTGREEKGCSFSLPLLQLGTATILSRRCKVCGFQLVLVRSRRRRTVVSCPRCYASRRSLVRAEKPIPIPGFAV